MPCLVLLVTSFGIVVQSTKVGTRECSISKFGTISHPILMSFLLFHPKLLTFLFYISKVWLLYQTIETFFLFFLSKEYSNSINHLVRTRLWCLIQRRNDINGKHKINTWPYDNQYIRKETDNKFFINGTTRTRYQYMFTIHSSLAAALDHLLKGKVS